MSVDQAEIEKIAELARIRIAPEDVGELTERITAAGYLYVTLDLAGFQSGSLNKALDKNQIQTVQIHPATS